LSINLQLLKIFHAVAAGSMYQEYEVQLDSDLCSEYHSPF